MSVRVENTGGLIGGAGESICSIPELLVFGLLSWSTTSELSKMASDKPTTIGSKQMQMSFLELARSLSQPDLT